MRPQALGSDGRYAVIAEIGEGGMGTLYLAEDRALKRRVALKVIRQDLEAQPASLARFRREAAVLASLRHPNLVQIFAVDLDGHPPYLVMELLEGEDLERRLLRGRPLAATEALRALGELGDALAHLHQARILHRDLKPANVFLDRAGRFRLMDFGLSLPLDRTRLTGDGQFVGTPSFLPPEVVDGGEHTAASDVYQLALVVWSAVVGRVPFEDAPGLADLLERIRAGLLEAEVARAALPAELSRALLACLAVAPARRPRDGAELCRLLRAPAAGRAPHEPFQEPRPAPRLWAPAIALVAALLGLALAARLRAPDHEARSAPGLAAACRELALLDGGAFAAVAPGGLRRPRLRARLDDGRELTVDLAEGERGPSGLLTGLPRGATLDLELLDGDAPVAASRVRLPEADLNGPVVGRFGLDRFSLAWRLHGRAAVDVVAESRLDGTTLRQRSRTSSAVLAPAGVKGNHAVAWRLELAGRTIARGEGTLGLSVRWRPAAVGGRRPGLNGPPVPLGDRVLLPLDADGLACLDATPSTSGTALRELWSARGLRATLGDEGELRAVVPGGSGALFVWGLGDPPRLGRLVPRDGEPPRVEPLDAIAGGALDGAAAARLTDGRTLLVSCNHARHGGRTTAAGRADLLDPATATLVASAPLEGAAVLGAVPLGSGAVAVTSLERCSARATLVVPTPDGALATPWSLALTDPDAVHLAPELVSFAACPGDRPDEALVVFGPTAWLLRLEGAGAVRAERVDLPLPPGAWTVTAQAWGSGRYVVGATVPIATTTTYQFLDVGAHAHLFTLAPGATGGGLTVTDAHLASPLVRRYRHCVKWGLLRHEGLVYLGVGYQFYVVRDAPGFPPVAEAMCESVYHQPFLLGGTVFVAGSDGSAWGVDVLSEP